MSAPTALAKTTATSNARSLCWSNCTRATGPPPSEHPRLDVRYVKSNTPTSPHIAARGEANKTVSKHGYLGKMTE